MHGLVERFSEVCRAHPHRPLIHLPAVDRALTALEIQELSRHYQDVLRAEGVAPGDIVLFVGGNRRGAIPLLLACWTLRAPVLLVDAAAPVAEVLELAARFHAAAGVIAPGATRELPATPLDEELALVRWQGVSRPSLAGASVLKLTSGTTGLPKGVLTKERQLLADFDHIVRAMGITPDDTQLVAVPLSHAYGLGNLILPLVVQGTAMVLREAFVPQMVAPDARKYGARVFHGVPFMYRHFLANAPAEGWPPTLTLLISAGTPLDIETIQEFHQRFGIKIHSFYGASEAGGIAYDSDEEPGTMATVGRPMPEVTISLRADPSVPEGYGRVHVRSAAVATEYVGDGAAVSDVSDSGFLTGDYGTFLEDGRLVLAGRVSSFINVAGRKVQPGEVERVLKTIGGVTDVCVLAAADPVRGEQIAAVIVGYPTLSLADVRRHCAARLAAYKIPRLLVLVERLPLTARGKVDFSALHALIEAQQTADRAVL